ncbi:MAG: hypothetical protein P4L43_08230 [Syntrophobacteraceae bacterium]|nr:hypothetical protein [Syntrophobacteraceae bacterium]
MLTLRNNEADRIEVGADNFIALAGNPNSGKTSPFNAGGAPAYCGCICAACCGAKGGKGPARNGEAALNN